MKFKIHLRVRDALMSIGSSCWVSSFEDMLSMIELPSSISSASSLSGDEEIVFVVPVLAEEPGGGSRRGHGWLKQNHGYGCTGAGGSDSTSALLLLLLLRISVMENGVKLLAPLFTSLLESMMELLLRVNWPDKVPGHFI